MKTVKVEIAKLLDVLRANRAKHHAVFLEAQEGYREAAITELDAMLKDAREGRRIRRTVSLVQPMDQTAEYDRAIAMLEMSVDAVVELDASDFQCFVLDHWHWRGNFAASNRGYVKSRENTAYLVGGSEDES